MFLGIDYGEKRIGLATADEETKIASPFRVLENKGNHFILTELNNIIEKEEITRVIVGLPRALSGKETDKTRVTREFIAFLAKNLPISVESFDERLSSRLADTLAPETKRNRDIGAAMVILEDYILSLRAAVASRRRNKRRSNPAMTGSPRSSAPR